MNKNSLNGPGAVPVLRNSGWNGAQPQQGQWQGVQVPWRPDAGGARHLQGYLVPTQFPAHMQVTEFVANAPPVGFPPPLPFADPNERPLVPPDEESSYEEEYEEEYGEEFGHVPGEVSALAGQEFHSSKRRRTAETSAEGSGVDAACWSPEQLRDLHRESLHSHPPRFPVVQKKRGVDAPVQEQLGDRPRTAARQTMPPGESRQLSLQEQMDGRILHLSPSEFSVASGRPLLTQSAPLSFNGPGPRQQPQESSGTVLARAFQRRREQAGKNNESAHLLVLEKLTSFHDMVIYVDKLDKLDKLSLQSLAKTLLTFAQTVRTSGRPEDIHVSRLAVILYLFTRRGFPSVLKNNLAELLGDEEELPADIDDLRPECVRRWQNVQRCTPQQKIVRDIVLRLYRKA